jgi:hypothetical protein
VNHGVAPLWRGHSDDTAKSYPIKVEVHRPRERVGRLAVATTPGLAPDFSQTCRLPPRHGQELRFAVDSALEQAGFEL